MPTLGVTILAVVLVAPIVARAQTSASSERASPALQLAVPGAPASVTAFVNVNVIPMDTDRVLAGQTVLVKGGRIIALGPAKRIKLPKDAVQVDARGKYLIPGMADMHTHIALTSWLSGGRTDSVEVEQRLFEWLSSGVTTVRNLDWGVSPTLGQQTLRFKARAAAGTLWSPRIYTAGPFLWEGKEGAPVSPAMMASYVAAYKAQGYDFIKLHNQESAEQLDSIVAAARRVGLPIMGHVPLDVPRDGSELARAFAAGYRSIEHLGGYHQHVYRKHVQPTLPESTTVNGRRIALRGDPIVDQAFMAVLRQQLDAAQPTLAAIGAATKQAGVWNTPTLALYVLHPLAAHYADALAFSQRLVVALQAAGAGLLLGTDAMGELRYTVQDELQALVTAGLTPYQALVTGTRNPALYFGTLNETGTIAIGKRADLVLLKANPLEDIRNTKQPAGVMIGGRWLSHPEIDRRLMEIVAERRATGAREAVRRKKP